jgi:hypothetical protein
LRGFDDCPLDEPAQTGPLCATPFAIPISFRVADPIQELLLQEVYSIPPVMAPRATEKILSTKISLDSRMREYYFHSVLAQ